MRTSRSLMLLAAGSLAAGFFALHAQAQSANTDTPSQTGLRPPVNIDHDTLHTPPAPSAFGLKPQPAPKKDLITLPLSLNYSSVTKSLTLPLDEKNAWDVGVMLNVNSGPSLEPATAPALGLQPKRTPGIMLQKRF